jgi:choline-sulfatase
MGETDESVLEKRRYYDEFIAYVDFEFGRLIRELESSGILEETLLIVTSDHGEMFERGITNHVTPTMYEPIIHIPLIIYNPKQPNRTDIRVPTSCIDLFPTLVHLGGGKVSNWCEGEILPPFIKGIEDKDRCIFVLEAKENPKNAPLTKRTVAMIKEQYKLIHYLGYKGFEDVYELYDLESDPEELFDLYGIKNGIASAMRDELLLKMEEVNRPYQ